MNDALLRLALLAIAAITALSGLVQLLAPGWVLGMIAPPAGAAEAHLFRTVGMFMLITGALFLQSLLQGTDAPAIALWIGVQKLLAAVLVAMGWSAGLFFALALAVAAFDLTSGLLALVFWWRIRR